MYSEVAEATFFLYNIVVRSIILDFGLRSLHKTSLPAKLIYMVNILQIINKLKFNIGVEKSEYLFQSLRRDER